MRWAGSNTRERVPLGGRRCAHPACGGEAHATMTFDYGSRTAWVDDLAETPLPEGYDLCSPHTRAFSVPQGWTRTDRRAGAVAMAGDDVPVAAPS